MSYFSGSDDGPDSADDRASIERVAAGGIPLSAEQRLRELTGGDTAFTSTLSVSEFALMQELGPQSLGQVMGASVHQVGWQYLSSSARWGRTVTERLDRVEQAWDDARRRAFDRMRQEAKILGADAVIGVRLSAGGFDWAANTVDYVVTGTAVRLPGQHGQHGRRSTPQLSDLSVQDYWKLAQSGWAPAGLCATTSVWFVSMSRGTSFNTFLTQMQNQELGDYSRGFNRARHAAVQELRGQAGHQRGRGIVGVTLEHNIHEASIPTGGYGDQGQEEREGLAITIHAVGTIVAVQSGRDTNSTSIMRMGS